MIKSIPAVWDETIVSPQLEIGELATYARRKGDTWFVAVMNGVEANKISTPLTFLKIGNYKATIISDDPASSASIKASNNNYSSNDVIKLDLTQEEDILQDFKIIYDENKF
jgi:alpha-glucosidase